MTALPPGPFDVVLADPPWSYYGQQDKWGAAAKFYPLMSDDDIYSLGVPDLLSPKGIVFLWVTSPKLDTGLAALREWGLNYRGVAFVWVKTRKDGWPIGAQGVRPSITKPTTELVLAGSRVKKGRPMPLHDEGIRQVVMAPKTEHSHKPIGVHEALEKMYPSARRVELFATEERPGWTTWGDGLHHGGD